MTGLRGLKHTQSAGAGLNKHALLLTTHIPTRKLFCFKKVQDLSKEMLFLLALILSQSVPSCNQKMMHGMRTALS